MLNLSKTSFFFLSNNSLFDEVGRPKNQLSKKLDLQSSGW